MSDIRIYTQPSTVEITECEECPNSEIYEGSMRAVWIGCTLTRCRIGPAYTTLPIPDNCPLPKRDSS